MSLIDKTYFVKDINIPDSDWSDLTAYITRYEKEVLQKLLGYELWKLVDAYDAGTSPQRIKDLVEGKEFTSSSGLLIKWNGLINDDLVSLIAYYVYYHFVRDNTTLNAMPGMLKQQGENSTNASNFQKLNSAWVNLLNLYQVSYDSAYSFLSENESDYPEWEFTALGSVNSWDL